MGPVGANQSSECAKHAHGSRPGPAPRPRGATTALPKCPPRGTPPESPLCRGQVLPRPCHPRTLPPPHPATPAPCPGAFFKAHRDTPMGGKHVGSLVVCLPCGPHQGGQLVLRHQVMWGMCRPVMARHVNSSWPARQACKFKIGPSLRSFWLSSCPTLLPAGKRAHLEHRRCRGGRCRRRYQPAVVRLLSGRGARGEAGLAWGAIQHL